MANIVFNIAKGRAAHYATLPAASDGLVAVVLDATGLEADATLRDYDDLAALLAGTSNEHTTLTRQALAGVTVSVDDAADTVSVDATDLTWTAPAAGSGGTGKLVICYDPDTTVGTDATLVPLVGLDLAVTPDGSNITVTFDPAGFYGAT